jgi:hypothetical protein
VVPGVEDGIELEGGAESTALISAALSRPVKTMGGSGDKISARRMARFDFPVPGAPERRSPSTGRMPPSVSSKARGVTSGSTTCWRIDSSSSSRPSRAKAARKVFGVLKIVAADSAGAAGTEVAGLFDTLNLLSQRWKGEVFRNTDGDCVMKA